MTEADKFRYFLLLQFNAPYKWGEETPEGSDCSGAVCLALYAATGHLISTTADDLYKRVFTAKPSPQGIRAAFFIDGKTGKAVHVAGLVGDGVILNSQEGGAQVRALEGLSAWFWNNGSSTAIRGLDRDALARFAADGKIRYDLDPSLSRYIDFTGGGV
jgi:murein DD-endopeptidase